MKEAYSCPPGFRCRRAISTARTRSSSSSKWYRGPMRNTWSNCPSPSVSRSRQLTAWAVSVTPASAAFSLAKAAFPSLSSARVTAQPFSAK